MGQSTAALAALRRLSDTRRACGSSDDHLWAPLTGSVLFGIPQTTCSAGPEPAARSGRRTRGGAGDGAELRPKAGRGHRAVARGSADGIRPRLPPAVFVATLAARRDDRAFHGHRRRAVIFRDRRNSAPCASRHYPSTRRPWRASGPGRPGAGFRRRSDHARHISQQRSLWPAWCIAMCLSRIRSGRASPASTYPTSGHRCRSTPRLSTTWTHPRNPGSLQMRNTTRTHGGRCLNHS